MKLFVSADHNGFDLKQTLVDYLRRGGYEVVDLGDSQKHPDDDFPQFAARVVNAMAEDPSTDVRGVLVGGDGQGMCIAANRFKGVRACLGWNQNDVRTSRNDNDTNVLCIQAEAMGFEETVGVIHTWLMTPFAAAPRFKRCVEELDELG